MLVPFLVCVTIGSYTVTAVPLRKCVPANNPVSFSGIQAASTPSLATVATTVAATTTTPAITAAITTTTADIVPASITTTGTSTFTPPPPAPQSLVEDNNTTTAPAPAPQTEVQAPPATTTAANDQPPPPPPPETTQPPPPPVAGDSTNISAKDKQDLVDIHNSYRAQNGVKSTVTYNDQVAAQAAVRAQYLASIGCTLVHGDLEGVGQNLSEESASFSLDLSMQSLAQGWMDEAHPDDGRTYNHATQMLWATTTEIGCAKAFGSASQEFPYCEVLVCDYKPAGNFVGRKWSTGN